MSTYICVISKPSSREVPPCLSPWCKIAIQVLLLPKEEKARSVADRMVSVKTWNSLQSQHPVDEKTKTLKCGRNGRIDSYFQLLQKQGDWQLRIWLIYRMKFSTRSKRSTEWAKWTRKFHLQECCLNVSSEHKAVTLNGSLSISL